MEWKDDYLIGIKEIDEQHKKLFEISESINLFKSISEIKELLIFLKDYINLHFDTEENQMRLNKYPFYEEHKKIHDDLKEKINGYIELYLMGNFTLFEELEEVLITWLETHILAEDKKYSNFIFCK